MLVKLIRFVCLSCLLLGISQYAQTQPISTERMLQLSKEQLRPALEEFRAFLRLPNLSRDKQHQQQNADWCADAFTKRGFKVQRLQSGDSPFVFAEKQYHTEGKTVLFYLQIDGQPVDPSRWDQADPFDPVLKKPSPDGQWVSMPWEALDGEIDPEWRIFGRSTSDSKGNGMALLAALDIAAQINLQPAYNIKVIMDLEEEIGSPNLPALVAEQQDLLSADMLVIMDGTRHVSNLPTLTFGARGIAKVTLTVFGAKVPLHSGQYGNFAPNPSFALARLLAGMKDESGRVTLPGYYDGINFSEAERRKLNDIPEDQDELRRELGIAASEQVGRTYQEALQYPTLNVRGMQAGWIGKEVRTIIPATATAEIDIRLVPESDPERLIDIIRTYVIEQGYHLVDSLPTEWERQQYPKLLAFDASVSYKAFRTPFDSDIGRFLESALRRAFDKEIVLMRTTGGSQPMAPFIQAMGLPAVALRIPNPDNNIHGPNENLRLGNFLEGIQSCLAVLSEPLP